MNESQNTKYGNPSRVSLSANWYYVASREEFDRIKSIIKENCDASRPANTTVICDLVTEEMRVEFEVTARIA
jgi:enamine deaminase RidA (YjgF/YER057c/UK114 family)